MPSHEISIISSSPISWLAGNKVLDWGAGDRLLVRMLRDIGLDAYHYDRYATNVYAPSFIEDGRRRYVLITAFEVSKHLAHPAEELDRIFRRRPDVHLLFTQLYRGQGSDWGCLWPRTGRHVFYSRKAMGWIAAKYGYNVLCGAHYTVFYIRYIGALRRRLLKLLLDGRANQAWDFLYVPGAQKSLIEKDRTWLMNSLG